MSAKHAVRACPNCEELADRCECTRWSGEPGLPCVNCDALEDQHLAVLDGPWPGVCPPEVPSSDRNCDGLCHEDDAGWCEECGSGIYELACDDCRAYMWDDAEPIE